ncbi:hypothetical protein CKAH01_02684 [Colletotrichum kahawae]|uniref:Uncharacterized protein n=1 Tax=Colletotrichum kahawae TaxID=34407 RepID=A0AAD9XY40_COLKA|nr:hypothetical protein CKAH01_02684 [Colletotrichum kahawae]
MNAHRKLPSNHPDPLTTSPNVPLSKQHQSPKKCPPEPQTFAHVGFCKDTNIHAVTKQLKRNQTGESLETGQICANIVYVTPASWNATMMGGCDSCMPTRRMMGLHVTLSLIPPFCAVSIDQ